MRQLERMDNFMKIFLTGATGLIGSAVLPELINNGHEVLALVRSDKAAEKVSAAGATPVNGNLNSVDTIKKAVEEADGVIHLAFNNDFSQIVDSLENDQNFIKLVGNQLVGTNKPFVITSALGQLPAGPINDETTPLEEGPISRAPSEKLALDFANKGVRISVVRPAPTVHSAHGAGFATTLIQLAQQKGKSAFIDGNYHWSAVHLLDIAVLYRLALEKAPAGSVFHGVAETSIKLSDIAGAIGDRLSVPVVQVKPEEAQTYFGFLASFVTRNVWGKNEFTRETLNWHPSQVGLLEDIRENYQL